MDSVTSPATAAPVLHGLSNHSGAESPMKSIHSTCVTEKEWESQALHVELNPSQNVSLGRGSDSIGQVHFPTDEWGGSSEAELVSSKDEVTREKSSIKTIQKDQNNDASGTETVHRKDVTTGSEESARRILGPSAERNRKDSANITDFELPKEVSTAPKGHYVGPMSPLTPDTCTTRPSLEFNRTMDLEPAANEAIAGLSPIIARESDYPMIERIPFEPRVDRSDSRGTDDDSALGPTSPLNKSNADRLQSQESCSYSDHALTNYQSTKISEDGDADTTEVSPEATEQDEIHDPQDIRNGTSLGTINDSIEAETKRMSSSNLIGEIDRHSELEHPTSHFEKQHETDTSDPEVFSVLASKTSEEDKAKTFCTSTSIGDAGNHSELEQIADTGSHSELEQIAAHFGEKDDSGTIDPEADYEAYVCSLPGSNTSEEDEAKRLGSENHIEPEQAAVHFGEGHETKADIVSRKTNNISEEDEAKRLSSLSSIGDMESHPELEQAATSATFFGGKQETVTSNPESSLEADSVADNVERTTELESSLAPSRQIDSLHPYPSELSNRDSFYSVENSGTQLESSRAYKDLSSAKKHLDASSLAFIERLRGAAHRRKLQVARSRDSLVAKEREQLLSIASAKERQLTVAPELPSTLQPAHDRVESSVGPYKPFKARPAPKTTGHFGSGGQVGVPKVEKKPATTPFSPLLGARRPRKEGKSFIDQTLRQSRKRIESKSLPFKARPAPATTGYLGHGGQAGVPKIPKRPATVPESPLLGKKRSSFGTATKCGEDLSGHGNRDRAASNLPSMGNVKEAGPFNRPFPEGEASKKKETSHRERQQRETVEKRNSRVFRARPLPVSLTSSASSPSPLLGLKILNTQTTPTRMDSINSENMDPQVATPRNPHSGIIPYEPHSTVRAKKRASFDERRASNEIVRQEEQQRIRKSVIKQTKKELIKLRDSLR